ncbi:MAG TPA: hypothetical protein VGB53_08735 [Rubricoccaceae bacterium]|jgi:hypothetical protein
MTRFSFQRFAVLPLLAALALALPACDSGGSTDGPPPGNTVANGVDFTRLFNPATPAEIAAIRADWAGRTNTATGIQVSAPATLPDGARVYIVSHEITTGPGASGRHYGFVRVPAGAASNLPVIVVHHGGDSGVKLESDVFGLSQLYPTLFSQTVQVFPSYRAEPLVTSAQLAPSLGATQTSGGTASPWDYDVDDAMTLLSAVLGRDEFSGATDEARIGALGFSRGANTALLHTARDTRVDAVTEYFGPSDFLNGTVQGLALIVLGADSPTRQGALQLPGARFLYENVLQPLQGPGGTYNGSADYDAARLAIIRRSASQFTSSLRNLQVHHHRRDGVVRFPFSVVFDAAVQAAHPQGAYEFNAYGDAPASDADLSTSFHSPTAMPESLPRTEQWLARYVVNPTATRVEAY